MRRLALIAAFALAGSASAETQPALTKLCQMLCGTWQSAGNHPAKVVWELDEPAGLMWGRTRSVSADGSVPSDAVVAIGRDVEKKGLWMMRSGQGDLPSIGGAGLTEKGYAYGLTLYDGKQSYGADVRFDGPDSYTEFFNFTTEDGIHADGADGPYMRVK